MANDIAPPAKRARTGGELSASEATQYDRQIRLWGLDAQRRIRTAKVLVVGATGVSAELCKNIVLAGVESVTLLDHRTVTMETLTAQFLVTKGQLGQNLAEASIPNLQKLNPNVEVTADTGTLESKPKDFFDQFTVVVVTAVPLQTLVELNADCRGKGIKFFAAEVFGYFGYIFSDLQEHEFSVEQKVVTKASAADSEGETKTVMKKTEFVGLGTALAHSWPTMSAKKARRQVPALCIGTLAADRFRVDLGHRPTASEPDQARLRQICNAVATEKNVNPALAPDALLAQIGASAKCELGPVSAIIGGMLASELIKAVSLKDTPHDNFFFFDGHTMEGRVTRMG